MCENPANFDKRPRTRRHRVAIEFAHRACERVDQRGSGHHAAAVPPDPIKLEKVTEDQGDVRRQRDNGTDQRIMPDRVDDLFAQRAAQR